jgi:fumarate hydratase class II
MKQDNYRIEKDSMGELPVPNNAYYGAQTMRAKQNFPISNLKFPRSFIYAIGLIKSSAAKVNIQLGLLEKNIGNTISAAATEVTQGKFDQDFIVDIFQTGSGTSTNMNTNEIIANRSIELLGGTIGSKSPVHPNDHVNLGQSSNDVIPTAIHIAAVTQIKKNLIPNLNLLKTELETKSVEFADIIKTGRTHLQDATPIKLGQEFKGYAGQIENNINQFEKIIPELSKLAIGGTAVGTGINTHPEFAKRICILLSKESGYEFTETNNHFHAQSTIDTIVASSSMAKNLAISLLKISNDIRWMGSGPRSGIGEITLPEVQPGSSIMPGKVNPVIPESVCQVAAQVIGNDITISIAGQSGNFELNVMMPVAGYNLLESIAILSTATENFANQCIQGITATPQGPKLVQNGLAIATALVPEIGYDQVAEVAKTAHEKSISIKEAALLLTNIPEKKLDELLDARNMTN